MTAKKIRNKEALQLLIENIANLPHPDGMIKHPYFDEMFAANKQGVRDLKRKFCEAIMLVLEEPFDIKKRRAQRGYLADDA